MECSLKNILKKTNIVYFQKLPNSQMHTFYSLVKLFDCKENKVTQTTK